MSTSLTRIVLLVAPMCMMLCSAQSVAVDLEGNTVDAGREHYKVAHSLLCERTKIQKVISELQTAISCEPENLLYKSELAKAYLLHKEPAKAYTLLKEIDPKFGFGPVCDLVEPINTQRMIFWMRARDANREPGQASSENANK